MARHLNRFKEQLTVLSSGEYERVHISMLAAISCVQVSVLHIAMRKGQEVTENIRVHPLGTMNIHNRFHGNPAVAVEICCSRPKCK